MTYNSGKLAEYGRTGGVMKREPVFELADRINESINAYSRTKTGRDVMSENLTRKALAMVWFVRLNDAAILNASPTEWTKDFELTPEEIDNL
jgi:hypothetical protein